MAKAIVEKALKEKIEFKDSPIYSNNNSNNEFTDDKSNNSKFIVKVGRGVSLFYDGHMISAGNIRFIEEQFKLAYNKNIEQLNPQFQWPSLR